MTSKWHRSWAVGWGASAVLWAVSAMTFLVVLAEPLWVAAATCAGMAARHAFLMARCRPEKNCGSHASDDWK